MPRFAKFLIACLICLSVAGLQAWLIQGLLA
jgi:hypothetical protein